MRKLIEKEQESSIVCDNPKCDFTIPYSDEEEKRVYTYINMPCPKCGQNLLTQEDYIQHEKIIRIVKWINKWFSWLTIFHSKGVDKETKISVHVHDGVKIKNESEKK